MSRKMDNKTEKNDDRVGMDVTLAEDGEKGPHCAHGECAQACEREPGFGLGQG